MNARPCHQDSAVSQLWPCDRIELRCVCGRRTNPAFAYWSTRVLDTPVRRAVEARKFRCATCGGRKITAAFIGTLRMSDGIEDLIVWPPSGE